MSHYDYLIVGAGLYGAVCAREAVKAGKKVLVIDKRPHIAGNVHTEQIEGINVHVYGAHIFHTNDRTVWDYVNQFAEFNRFTNSPVANYKGELYSLPFNMYTFNKMWGVVTPAEAEARIEEQKREAGITEPKNLEEQVGVTEDEVPIATRMVLERGLTLVGCSRSGRVDFENAVEFLRDKKALNRVERIISETVEINSIEDIYTSFEKDLVNPFKTVLKWNI